ncbi:MAG: RluA family pseudouridine synthase, partial [Polaribacter sp.]|nr:RluA family pseudouridine synthase [Polaribacter sp.]
MNFHYFKTDISSIQLPEKFTFPFYYEPHTLAKIAANELQVYLETQTDFKHDFGFEITNTDTPIGKMFGVLVVKNKKDELGYLAAFSGKLADNSLPTHFVPPVFNMRTEDSFYVKGEAEIDAINRQITVLKNDENYVSLKKSFKQLVKMVTEDLAEQRKKMKISKSERRIRKKIAEDSLIDDEFKNLTKKLEQESYNDQFFYKELQEYYNSKINKLHAELLLFESKIDT